MPVPITLKSPLPAKDLMFESMTASAGLSMLGEMQLGLVSEKPDLKPEDLLGKPMTVSVALRDDKQRHFHGYVTRFGIGAHRGRYFGYQASVRPWLWFLTRTADCRIFQEQSVPDIVKKVFEDHGNASFEFKLFRSYRKWVYCVQYRETDYNFVARLLEHEGIYWYIEHGEGTSKVVLVDSQSAHDAAPGYESLPYYENAGGSSPDTECVSDWSFASEVETDKVALTSYDFERPSTSLKADAKKSHKYSLPDFEMFDFQGDYIVTGDGTQWAEDRLDERQSRFQMAHGGSNAHGIEVGRLLKLAKHPRADQNDKYLITAIAVNAHVDAYESNTSANSSAGAFRCDFSAIPSGQQFRPPRRTPKPFVQGPQTAVVVGPGGEEIFTDKYGRVKVQFHWDRLGKKNEKSSCWVRVSHPWAGKNFGLVHIPRMGQEVVVDFLEGDPDQPMITGRVYNAEQMPPWDLPANATQSGILTRSSKGGSAANANALRFEDKKGSEQVWLHAEKNQDIEVENDETHWVGHDRTKTIDHDETSHIKHDRTETVDNNETITIHKNRTEKVDLNEGITIGVNRTESVGSNETITVGSNRSVTVGSSETKTVTLQRTHTVGVNETISVGAAQEITIGALQAVTVGAAQTITVGANQTTSVGAAQTTTVGANQATTVGGDRAVKVAGKQAHNIGGDDGAQIGGGRSASVGKDDAYSIAKKFSVDAGEEISLVAGDASIVLKKDGSITIKGKDLLLEASGKVSVKASGEVAVKGSKIGLN
jgi:type VI secretion system secreted protein VgrG